MKLFPKISIVVLNFNGKDVLKSCLFSVLDIDYPNFEAIVVDNNSNDGSLEEAKKLFSNITFVKNEKNLGYAAGNNVGIRHAIEKGSDYVLLLNNDTKVASNLFKIMMASLEDNEKIGIASPVVFKGDSKDIWFSGGKINWFLMKAVHTVNNNQKRVADSEFISGCCMLVNRVVFEKIGLLDENFFLYLEDVDFSFRAKKAGFRCVVLSNCQIYHYEKSEEKKPEKIYWLVLSGLIFFKKNSTGLLRGWSIFFIFFRRIKNKIDILRKKNIEIAQAVNKAYCDFDKLK
jgi:GT2 family glycosyltransferase